jgi:hypothetical protein
MFKALYTRESTSFVVVTIKFGRNVWESTSKTAQLVNRTVAELKYGIVCKIGKCSSNKKNMNKSSQAINPMISWRANILTCEMDLVF